MSKYEELRVQFKLSSPKANPSTKKPGRGDKVDVVGPELDNIINAASRPFKCYRAPITAFYENDRTTHDGEDCLPNSVGGCARCRVSPSPVCCSLCSPSHAAFQILPPARPPIPSVPRASTVPNKYKMSSTDRDFHTALDNFRRARTKEEFGLVILNNLGPGLIMGDTILDRIADCARVHKLDTLETLYRETKWDLTWELGEQVLDLAKRFYPPLVPSRPLNEQGNPDANRGAPGSNTRGGCTKTCSACGQYGHIRSNRICSEYGKHTPGALCGKENRVPETNETLARGEDERATTATAAGSAAASHSHPDHVAVAAMSVSSSGATPLAGNYDEFFGGYLESPTYLRTRLVLSPAEIEAKLRAGKGVIV